MIQCTRYIAAPITIHKVYHTLPNYKHDTLNSKFLSFGPIAWLGQQLQEQHCMWRHLALVHASCGSNGKSEDLNSIELKNYIIDDIQLCPTVKQDLSNPLILRSIRSIRRIRSIRSIRRYQKDQKSSWIQRAARSLSILSSQLLFAGWESSSQSSVWPAA